jgi:TolB-like protein/Flp pilus assembly protein TadD/predicted Ser/Thr protein kinase
MQANNTAVTTPIGARLCQQCGAKIFATESAGFCSACFLEAGLNSLANDDSVPAEFGDYELLGEIGRGGQGVVFRARQKSLNRIVALKVIGLGNWATETHLKRFRREAEAAASLEHPRIVPIYEIGERDGACYFTMQFVEGGQLDELVRHEPLPLRSAAVIIASLAHTVHYAHERGILHRDIKPGNILLDAAGEPHLTDFGLARLVENESTVTRTLEVLGTPSYIAPEQAAGNVAPPTSATDVYGLGAVFYHLLTGHPPFAGGTTYETIRLVLETEPRNPRLWNSKVDRDLDTICLKCLEKDPLRRYHSALALAEDLERWLCFEPIPARRSGLFTRGRKWIRRNPTLAALLPLSVALAASISLLLWHREPAAPPAGIAVLPFENLDGNKANATFADGIQDDILTKLARIADLKVISRRSVMDYRGTQNTRQIGAALHVSHVLEGSFRRDDRRIRLNVELVDTRTDQQTWAEEYDRDLSDVFEIQSEVAQEIADELRVKLSPSERAAIAKPPTKDVQAYDFYVYADTLIGPFAWAANPNRDVSRGITFLKKAVARDPNFLLAYCKLANAYDFLGFNGGRSPEILALAGSAVNSAFRLAPNSGEAHLALAYHLYWGYLDYDRARGELAIAGRTLPNDPRVDELAGLIDRRQGRWPEAIRELERSVELDPRNQQSLQYLGTTYKLLGAYKQAADAWNRALALKPTDVSLRLSLAELEISERADVRPLKAIVQTMIAEDPEMATGLAEPRFWIALDEHDIDSASELLTRIPENEPLSKGLINLHRSFFEGMIARMKGNETAARASFDLARTEQEKILQDKPDRGSPLAALSLIDAELGRNNEALDESRRAVALMPLSKSSLEGADALASFAMVCALTGNHDLAITQLEKLTKVPGGTSYGDLRLSPFWDSLRGDPRFEKIVASLAPTDSEK